MNKSKILSSILTLLLSLSMICYLNLYPGIHVVHAQLTTYPIVLPFRTGFEPVGSEGKGRTNIVDWKTNNFIGYYGSGNPECGVVPVGDVQRPQNGFFTFGTQQLRARGWFGAYPSYCYFDLFDQSDDCDYRTPIQLQNQTFISIWYFHAVLSDCMIDGELYNVRTGQVWTLRDFNINGVYIVDQNGVRIHPASRDGLKPDPIGSWQYAAFDLSMVYNSDPGNWYITKLWIGFDNGIDHAQGAARTYFDDLEISYGVSGTSGKQHVRFTDIFGITISETDAQVTGSAVPWYWTGPDGSGNYHLMVKVMDSGWVSNPVDTHWNPLVGNYYWSPYNLMTNCSQSSFGVKTVARSDMDVVGVNLTTSNKIDPGVSDYAQYAWDCFDVAAGILCPEMAVVDVLVLVLQGEALFFNSGQPVGNTYTYQWAQANNSFDSGGFPCPTPSNIIQSDFGEVMLDIPVPPSSRNFQIPIRVFTDVYCCTPPIASGYHWVYIGTLQDTFYLTWTTPDIDPRPASASPIVGFSTPAPAGSFGVCHLGNPNWNDCNMYVNVAGQGTAAWVPTGATIPVSYYGYIWAQPNSPTNKMYAVVGIGNTALSASPSNGGTTPGVYPGLPFSATYNLAVGSYQPGTYNFYGVAAAQTSVANAMAYYNNNPSARFLLGTMTLYPASTGIGQYHGPIFTVSACVNPPFPYLLKSQTLNGNSGYVFTELTNAAGSVVIGWQGMTCTSTITQAVEDGGNFTYSYNLATVPVNQYYYLWFNATGTNGQSQTATVKIYYYDNPPNTPNPLSGSTPQYVNTLYSLSTSTTDPEGDNINYTYDWGDNSAAWTSGWVASGTVVNPSHSWSTPGTYTVSVKAKDTYGLWSNPRTLPVTVTSQPPPPPGGGGCPYVYTWNGISFVKDNNILPASENGNGTVTEDYYLLQQSLASVISARQTSVYSLQIKEFENEQDYVDQAKLLAVDHSQSMSIAVTPEGEILTYKNPASPNSCVDNKGTDRLSEIATTNGNVNDASTYFQGYKGDWLLLDFGRVTAGCANLILRDDQKCADVCINVQVPDGNAGWQTVEVLHPRDFWALEAVNMTAYIPTNGDFVVRLLWTATHRLDYVGLDTSPQAQVHVSSALPTLAVHSTMGDVTRKLLYDDENYVKLVNGQQITLWFILPNKAQGTTRDFILYTDGYYYTITP